MEIQKTIKNVLLQTVALSIILVVIGMVILGCSGDEDPVKNAISIYGSYFGGIATLVAAYIASKLFYDWKDEHNFQILAHEAKEAFHLIHIERDYIHDLKFKLKDIIDGTLTQNVSWCTIGSEYEKEFLDLYNTDKNTISAFCFLSKGQSVYDLTMDYYKIISKVTKYLSQKKNENFSDTTFLDEKNSAELLELLKILEKKNELVLSELKKYILTSH